MYDVILEKKLLIIFKKTVIMAINKVILVGHVGKDPEVRYFDTDTAVANFTLATTERGFKAKDGQEIPDRTEWHNIVAWRGLAKLAEMYIKKGTQLYIEGKIRSRSWDDQNGLKRYVTEIYAETIQLLGKKPDTETVAFTSPQNLNAQNAAPQVNSAVSNYQEQSEDTYLPNTNEVEDDLPF